MAQQYSLVAATMLGIAGYEPDLFATSASFLEEKGAVLQHMLGQSIDSYHQVWSVEANQWFREGPVIFQIGPNQFEWVAHQLNFGLTLNQISLEEPIGHSGSAQSPRLRWAQNQDPLLQPALHRLITGLGLIEYDQGGRGYRFIGIQLIFDSQSEPHRLNLYNGLDELAYDFRPIASEAHFQVKVLTR